MKEAPDLQGRVGTLLTGVPKRGHNERWTTVRWCEVRFNCLIPTVNRFIPTLGASRTGCAELQAAKRDASRLVALIDRLHAGDGSVDLQVMAILATHRHGECDAVMAALERTLHRSRHRRVRSAVASVLGEIATPRAIALLRVAEGDSHRFVRDNARFSLDGLDRGELQTT